jgi:hypothetical protein
MTAGRAAAPFDVVDVLELDHGGHITALRIVYDTADIRPIFKQETRRRSWRAKQPASQ